MSIGTFKISGLDEVSGMMEELSKGFGKKKLKINEARAKSFLKFTKTELRRKGLSLTPNTVAYAKRKLAAVGHTIPMIYRKHLINHMANRTNRKDGSVESGYFSNDSTRHPDAKGLTMFQLVARHTKGTGDIPPRPFVWNAGTKFDAKDDKIIVKELNKIIKKALK